MVWTKEISCNSNKSELNKILNLILAATNGMNVLSYYLNKKIKSNGDNTQKWKKNSYHHIFETITK